MKTPQLGSALIVVPATGATTTSDPTTTGIPGNPANVDAALAELQAEIAALTPASLIVQEIDGSPTIAATEIDVPNGTLDVAGSVATLNYIGSRNRQEVLKTVASSGAAQTLDWSLYNSFDITLTANCTISFSNIPASGADAHITLVLRQGGTGSYTVTWPASVKWQSATGTDTGSAPTLWTAVGAQDDFELSSSDGGTTVGGFMQPHPTTGTVSSVALSMPAEFSVAGSPITSSGTLAVTAANESANTVWAGPTSGAAAAPSFRALVSADISELLPPAHAHVNNVTFSGDGATTVFYLPAAPVDNEAIGVYVAGSRSQDWALSGTLFDTLTFGSPPASGTDNIVIDIAAALA